MTENTIAQTFHPIAAPVEVGDIVQCDPTKDTFGGCMIVVTEVKSWGIQGYVQNAGQVGQAYIRLNFGDFEPTGGKAIWMVQ